MLTRLMSRSISLTHICALSMRTLAVSISIYDSARFAYLDIQNVQYFVQCFIVTIAVSSRWTRELFTLYADFFLLNQMCMEDAIVFSL